MSEAQAASGLDRLPWLADEPRATPRKAKSRPHGLLGWAGAAVLLVAGASIWLGTHSEGPQASSSAREGAAQPSTTVPLPRPQVSTAPVPQVATAPAPEVRAAPVPEVHPALHRTIHLTRAEAAAARRSAAERRVEAKLAARAPAEVAPARVVRAAPPLPVVAHAVPLRPWQPRVVSGAAGRLVEVGAFGSVYQAKLGWRYMVRTYPAVARLPAVVRPDRNSHGRIFYRFRVGTTSQAHSEVLCQRMQRIGLSCAVVGLPWKAKVER